MEKKISMNIILNALNREKNIEILYNEHNDVQQLATIMESSTTVNEDHF